MSVNIGKKDQGECRSLTDICEEHEFELPPYNHKFSLRPAISEEAGFSYALPKEQDAKLGAIGHVRIDFGSSGKEFWHTWWPRGKEELNGSVFKEELEALVNELREAGPLSDLNAMYSYCASHDGEIRGSWRQNYGYVIETESYRYCLRCSPGQGDYHAYLTAFDLRIQQMNMNQFNPEQEYGLTEAGKKILRDAADPALSRRYSWFVFQNFNMPGEKLIRNLMLPEAIQLYNELSSRNKRLGVTKDDIATVDLVIMSDGEQKFSKDYMQLASFSSDKVIADAIGMLQNEITEQSPEQGMKMGGI